MDFTIKTYKKLINTLRDQGFSFTTFRGFLSGSSGPVIILRHDVDLRPLNSLEFARIQAGSGIKGTYYFRLVPESFNENVIREISSLGHEIGYHYEDLSLVAKRQKREKTRSGQRAQSSEEEEELAKIAIGSFAENLAKLRRITPVKTICMHGSPMSRWDSRLLWKYYDYRDYGILGEPYFDVNFEEVLYLTDTGRRWDGDLVNVRDKVSDLPDQASDKRPRIARRIPILKFHSTFDIIQACDNSLLPDKVMMTFHPQRWTDKTVPWITELIWQNTKNRVKYFVVRNKGNI